MDKIIRRGNRQTCSNAIIQCRDDEKRSQNQMTTSVLTDIKLFSCPFKSCGCSFESNDSALVDKHSQNDVTTHLNVSILFYNLFVPFK